MENATTNNHAQKPATEWAIQDSDELYGISRWGNGYFSINDKGHLTILPEQRKDGPTIDITEVIEEIRAKNILFPTVIRFHDILRSQVVNLNRTFRDVIENAGYHGHYYGVYPIKVNQMREVVEEIIDAGAPYNFGLEAGSRPEILAALAMNSNRDSLTVLNGYKDEDYLRLALLGRKLGRKMIVVIEKFSELPLLLKLSREMNIEPMIGLRAKLSAEGSGRWAESGGERAKFGLTVPEILNAIKLLKDAGKQDYLKLLHFHVGSQITDIRTVKDAITEGARIYAKIAQMNIDLEYFDVGGGLGIDYDGSRSTAYSSTNYTMRDYIEDVVYILKQVCDLEEVKHPHIVSESGRFISASHSCVIFNVFDYIRQGNTHFPTEPITGEHIMVSNMRDLLKDMRPNNIQETYNDAVQLKEQSINAFKLGILGLEERAKIETMYWSISFRINSMLKEMEFIPEGLKQLEGVLSQQYLCNFSIFQSTPDSWAIGQLFPIVPLTRLNEKPTEACTLADITCDSDGKIDEFIDVQQVKQSLMVHRLQSDQHYYMGIFLTGAYQEVMGDMHNLFGCLNEVHIFCDDEDPTDFYIEEFIPGTTCDQALAQLQYNAQFLASIIKKTVDSQVHRGKLNPREGVNLVDFYEDCLKSYTYLEDPTYSPPNTPLQ
jgi:arginine decarboxylase